MSWNERMSLEFSSMFLAYDVVVTNLHNSVGWLWPDMSKIRFSLVGIDTWFIRDRDLGRVWDWDWDLGSEISEKSPEISENIARDRDFPYIISEKLPRFGRDWYFSCIAAWISTRWLYFYRENSGKNGRDLGFRGHDVIYSGPRWTCLVVTSPDPAEKCKDQI